MWGKGGQHTGWFTAAQVVEKLATLPIPEQVPRGNVSRWLSEEKDDYDKTKDKLEKKDKKGWHERPEMGAILKGQNAPKPTKRGSVAKDKLVKDEPDCDRLPNSKFPPRLIPQLKLEVMEFVGFAGFSVSDVQMAATRLYHEDRQLSLEKPVWVPSETWVYWFLHAVCRLTPRVVTTHVDATPEELEQQRALHQLNLEAVAIFLNQLGGGAEQFIFMSDEFASHLFPVGDVMWAPEGAKHVPSDLPSDKRQITADTIINGAGRVIAGVQIWEGKTDRVLPLQRQRDMFASREKRLLFFNTHNHWATHDTKLKMLEYVWQWVNEEWQLQGRRGTAKCLYFLDCWSVNVTAILRSEVAKRFPGMTLRFIPAKATGKYQINDTHLHFPMKTTIQVAAKQWRMSLIRAYRQTRDMEIRGGQSVGKATEAFQDKCNALMEKAILRSKACEWHWLAIERILRAEGAGGNLISKGWQEIYFGPAKAEGFLQDAYANKAKRDEARTQALVQHGVAQAQGRDPPPVLLDEERLAEQCSKLESTQHEAQISTVEAPQVLSKKRRPKNRADERVNMVTSRLAADKAAEEAPEAGVAAKKRRRKALPGGPSSQPAVPPIITID
jgi:hypothetical protein